MCHQLHMKVDFTIFPSIYNTWVGNIEIGTEFTMNLEVRIWTAAHHLQLSLDAEWPIYPWSILQTRVQALHLY
jgi:hypothetical protein